MIENRREFSRIPIVARIKFLNQTQDDVFYFTEDISEGGLQINTETPPFVGTVLELQISIPNVDQMLNVKGEVVWRQDKKGCGVRFTKITKIQQKLIKSIIES